MGANNNRNPASRQIAMAAVCCLILIACGVPSSGTASATLAPTVVQITKITKQLMVVADVANLRAGPGTMFEQVGVLKFGDLITAVGVTPSSDWYLVALSKPQNGANQAWIAADFVAPPSTPTHVPTITKTATQKPTTIVTASAVPAAATEILTEPPSDTPSEVPAAATETLPVPGTPSDTPSAVPASPTETLPEIPTDSSTTTATPEPTVTTPTTTPTEPLVPLESPTDTPLANPSAVPNFPSDTNEPFPSRLTPIFTPTP